MLTLGLRQLEAAQVTEQSGRIGAGPIAVRTPIRLDGRSLTLSLDHWRANDDAPAFDSRGWFTSGWESDGDTVRSTSLATCVTFVTIREPAEHLLQEGACSKQ